MKVQKVTGIRFDGLGVDHENVSHVFGPTFGCLSKREFMDEVDRGESSFWMTNAGWSSGGYVMVRTEAAGGAVFHPRQIRTQSFTGFGNHLLCLPNR